MKGLGKDGEDRAIHGPLREMRTRAGGGSMPAAMQGVQLGTGIGESVLHGVDLVRPFKEPRRRNPRLDSSESEEQLKRYRALETFSRQRARSLAYLRKDILMKGHPICGPGERSHAGREPT